MSTMSGTAARPATEAPPSGPDPRARVGDGAAGPAVLGTRCTECEHPSLEPVARCPVCRGISQDATFAGHGTVFSSTVLRIPVGEHEPPTVLLYVDLDDGPRLLGHAPGDHVIPPGTRVRLTGVTALGDPLFVAESWG